MADSLKRLRHYRTTLARSEMALVAGLVLAWQAALTVIGFIVESVATTGHAASFISHTVRWDAGWFMGIVNHAYWHSPGQEAFYPLFPMLVKALEQLSFGVLSASAAGLLLNTIMSCLAACALYQISAQLLGSKRAAWVTVALFVTSPAALFLHEFYSEAVFCALGFWAYLYALRRNWMLMGVCLALLSATRITALLFILLCLLEFWRAHHWSIREPFNKQALWFLLAPLGFIAYGLYLLATHGDFLLMFHAYDMVPDWTYHVFNPNFLYTFAKALYGVVLIVLGRHDLVAGNLANVALPSSALLVLTALSLYSLYKIKQWAVPLGLFGLASLVFFTLNSNVVSVHRYVLPVITIYLAIGYVVQRWPKYLYLCLVGCGLSAMAQAMLFYMIIQGYFVG